MVEIRPSATGERAAMGGYVPQYDEFSRRVYDQILQRDLVEIRVADAEYNVGKLDDICYVTTTDVYGYQVKWTITDKEFTCSDFISLIREVADGWRKLQRLYPAKVIHTLLITNKQIKEENTVRDKGKNKIGSFNEYINGVIEKLHTGEHIDSKWNSCIDELKIKSSLSKTEWQDFWRSFTLKTGYEVEEIRIEDIDVDQRKKDIFYLNGFIQQAVADKSRKAVYSFQQIINALGWQRRIETNFNHSLTISEATYEPILGALDELNRQLRNKTKGYIFLEGSPGSGKSTILTQWANSIPNKTVRYYTFDFTNPSSSKNNDWQRGDSSSFLFDMVLMMESEFDTYKRSLPNKDYISLRKRFYELLSIISVKEHGTGLPTVIIVDGLDHISREYTLCTHTLISVLPSLVDLPDGIVFVLGSQYFDKLPLSKDIIAEYRTDNSTVKMPPFSKQEVGELVGKVLEGDKISASLIDKCFQKSQGHPLYLRYILNYLKGKDDANIDEIASYSGDVELYYDRLLAEEVVDNADLKHMLALMSRLNGDIQLNFVEEWKFSNQTKMSFRKLLFHLFVYDREGNTLRFFHNSFRQYLLNRTSTSSLTGEYNERTNLNYYKELAGYVDKSNVSNKWDEGYYLYHAYEYDKFIEMLTPEALTRQMHDFRPLWHVIRDVDRGLYIAGEKKDVYLIVRYLLLKNQIGLMSQQDYDGLNIVPELLKVNKSNLAKFLIHSGDELHCNQYTALNFAKDFIDAGDIIEANALLDLSYPYYMNNSPADKDRENNRIDYMSKLAVKWVEVAAYLLPKQKIAEHYQRFAHFLHSYSECHDDKFDDDIFYFDALEAYTTSLIKQHRFSEFDSLTKSVDTQRHYIQFFLFRSYLRAIKELLSTDYDNGKIEEYYIQAVKYCVSNNSTQILQLSTFSYKLHKDENTIKQYLSKVEWDKLDDYHMPSIEDKFERLQERIIYVELASALGMTIDISQLIPDNEKDVDSPLLNDYVRMVMHLAELKGKTWSGKPDTTDIISLTKHYLSFCDSIPFNSNNRYAYAITQQRADYYSFLVSVVSCFDKKTKDKFIDIVTEYFHSKECKANALSKRSLVLEWYKSGGDKDKCTELLSTIELSMLDRQDVDGASSELLAQGKAWMLLGNINHAFELFHKMIDTTFGVGYRKDYQPSTFMEWIVNANIVMPDKATERLAWFTQRLRHIYNSSENAAGRDASIKMMKEAFRINISYGVHFAEWMLDKEFTSFLVAFGIVMKCLFNKVSTEEEFWLLLHLYTDVYLYTDSPSDPSPSLLRKILDTGNNICPQKEDSFRKIIIKAIKVNCPEDHREELFDVINNKTDDDVSEHYLRETDKLIIEAEKINDLGLKDKAWEKAEQAVASSNSYGWSKGADGGTRIKSCRMLQKVDKERGRNYTIQLFVEDLIKGNAYGASQYLDDILPLLSDNIDEQKLFKEEFGYMNRILRDDAVCMEDTPTFEPNDMTVIEAVIDWCVYLSKLPIFSIVEQVMILLARVECKENIIDYIPDDRKKLELGMYLIELQSPNLKYFQDVAEKYILADNYLLRIYSRIILNALGIQCTQRKYRKRPSIYQMFLPEYIEEDKNLSWNIDYNDVNSIMRYADIITNYLSWCTDINKENLNYRAYLLLKEHGCIDDVSYEAEKRLHSHLNSIYLYYKFPQHCAMVAIDVMMEVAAELIDCNAVPNGCYYDPIFMEYDFANIKITTIEKPDFIQRISEKGMWYVHRGWLDHPEECIRFNNGIEKFCEDELVIGEYTRLIKPGDNYITEDYLSCISQDDYEQDPFFDDPLLQKEEHCYYNDELPYKTNAIVIRRGGYFYMYTLKETWIAINPDIAKSLGWRHSDKGMFAWEDEKGNVMAQSFYWRSGNVQYIWRTDEELGEGWFVVVSKEAYSALRKVGYVIYHQLVHRQLDSKEGPSSMDKYNITKLG